MSKDPEHINETIHRWLEGFTARAIAEGNPPPPEVLVELEATYGPLTRTYDLQFAPAAAVSVRLAAVTEEAAIEQAYRDVEERLPLTINLAGGLTVHVDRDIDLQSIAEVEE